MAMFLTQQVGTSVGVTGVLSDNGGHGWGFISYVQRGNGRKLRDTAEAAIPRWFTGYMVDGTDARDALELTEAYREGRQWAVDRALDGFIKVVRNGKVQQS